MVKSQNQNVHIWNSIADTCTFMIFASMYVLASLSVLKTHTGLENNLFQYVFDIAIHLKIVDNVTQTISVASIIGYDWKQFGILILLLKSKLLVTNSSGFPTIKNIYFEVNTVNLW